MSFASRKISFIALVALLVVASSIFYLFMNPFKPPKLDVKASYTSETVQGAYVFIDLRVENSGSGFLENVTVNLTSLPCNWSVVEIKPLNYTRIARNASFYVTLKTPEDEPPGNKSVELKVSTLNAGSMDLTFNFTVHQFLMVKRYLNGVLINVPSTLSFMSRGNVLKGEIYSPGSKSFPITYKLSWEPRSNLTGTYGNITTVQFAGLKMKKMGVKPGSPPRFVDIGGHRAVTALIVKENFFEGFLFSWFSETTDRAYVLTLISSYAVAPFFDLQITPLLRKFFEIQDFYIYQHSLMNDSLFLPIYWNATLDEKSSLIETNNSFKFIYSDPLKGVYQELFIERTSIKERILNMSKFNNLWLSNLSIELGERGEKFKTYTNENSFYTYQGYLAKWRIASFTAPDGQDRNYLVFSFIDYKTNTTYIGYWKYFPSGFQSQESVAEMFINILYSYRISGLIEKIKT